MRNQPIDAAFRGEPDFRKQLRGCRLLTHRVISLPCNNQVASGQSRHFVAGKTACSVENPKGEITVVSAAQC
jgi:hypothetical protein